ncbi:MAG: ABC transporter permease, partial [Bacteroidota bacterium]
MFDLDKWQEIYYTVQKHKLRTFLTGLGVFWGIFMLVFLMGAGKGLENGVLGLFGGHARNSMYMWSQKTTKAYKGLPPGRNVRLTMDDMEAIATQFSDEIAYLAPRMWVPSGEVIHGKNKAAFDVRGDCPDLIHIDAIVMQEGRFINQFDMEDRRKVAVIGRRVKEVLFEGEEDNVIGKFVKI